MRQKKKKWIILPVAMALLLLFFARFFDISPLESIMMQAAYPFTAAALRTSNGAAMAFQAVFDLKNSSAENAALREENQQLAGERAKRMDLEKENDALRKQLGIEPRTQYTLVGARIAGFDPLSFSHYAVIDKGARDGIKENMPVIMAGGVVFGKVTEVHDGFSRVMLVSDAANKVSVKTASEKASGVLSGTQGNALRMDLIEKSADIAADELVVTSGIDNVYPRGLAVGWVKEVVAPQEGIFKQAYIRPAYAEGFTTTVFIITDYLQ